MVINYLEREFYSVFGNERHQRKCLLDDARVVKRIAREFENYNFRRDLTREESNLLEGDLKPLAYGVLGGLKKLRKIPLYILKQRVSRCREGVIEILERAKSLVAEG